MNELDSVNFVVVLLTTLSKKVSPNQIALKRVNSSVSNDQQLSLSTVSDQMAGIVWASERSKNNYHRLVMLHWIGTHMSVKALSCKVILKNVNI